MIFPENFFEKEIRNDFSISEMMKRAWAAEVEVLEVVDIICKKHNLTWFADGGTLLGSIRHQGFIPWDDDIDIAMLRKDYNKLIEILPDELPKGFAMAGMYSNEVRMQNAAKVQQLRVIADEKYWNIASYMNRFHGFPCLRIGIDIFPIDYVYDDKEKDEEVMLLYAKLMNILTNWDDYNKKERIKKIIVSLEKELDKKIRIDDNLYNRLWKISDELISEIPEEKSSFVTNYFYRCYYRDRGKDEYIIDKNAYIKAISKSFETFEVPVPFDYDAVLKAEYGDYMKFEVVYNAHNYPFYKTQLEEFEKLLKASNVNIPVEEFCRNWININNQLKTK